MLERHSFGSGSTGRSVACADLLTQHPCVAALQVRSLHAFQHSQEFFGDKCGRVNTGFAMLAESRAAAGLREVARVLAAAGGQVDLLCP